MSYTQFVIDLENMFKNMENTFAGFPTLSGFNGTRILEKPNVPNIPFDLYKTDKEITINVAIPGKTKDKVSITSERINGSNYLKISIEENESKNIEPQVKKIKDISGDINIKIGDSWKLKELSASVENGLLTITIPKKSEEEIKSSIKTYTIN